MKPGIKKHPQKRWALPDRVFFGNGACHILAGVYLQLKPLNAFYAERFITGDGFAGGHMWVTDGVVAFDYHGYSLRLNLLHHHTNGWNNRYEEGWHCELERVNFIILSTRELNQRKMQGPDQYFGDPVQRAKRFINRVDHANAYEKARIKTHT